MDEMTQEERNTMWGNDYPALAEPLRQLGEAERAVARTVSGIVQENTELRQIIDGLCHRFGYVTKTRRGLALATGGLSNLEEGFEVLGWEDPHLIPERECEIRGCREEANCGVPTTKGYMRVCGTHMEEVRGT